MAATEPQLNWLNQYEDKEQYKWQTLQQCNRLIYYRPLGLVENLFDSDGRYSEGRADLNAQLDLEVKCSLSDEDRRERILFAWTCLRCKHLLLQAKALQTKQFYGRDLAAGSNICFAIHSPATVIQAVEDAGRELVFLEDHFNRVDSGDFWTHCQNTARVVDPDRALARLFVHPLEPHGNGRSTLRLLLVGAHQIQDGRTTYNWMTSFIEFLNQPVPELRTQLRELLQPEAMYRRLPPPQEALYPLITGNKARQRWFWLLTRILRHVRNPLQAGFENPLRRITPRSKSTPLAPTYSPLLDYSKTPPCNAQPLFAKISPAATQRLVRICRQANSSVGAGCFALAALLMMEAHEQREPSIPLHERKAFVTGFPIDPRAFFNHSVKPDSLMLAFSDGILLPFLSSSLDLEGRLRLLIRQAHRQLAAYQKRPNGKADEAGLQYMGSRGTGRILAVLYVATVAGIDSRIPEQYRRGLDPQGAYPMRPNATLQTCGVSSVGRRENLIQRDLYDLDDESKDFVVDYRNISATVRPRDGEFLVGIGGDYDGIWMNASVDANFIDPRLAEEWRRRFETILEEPAAKVSRL